MGITYDWYLHLNGRESHLKIIDKSNKNILDIDQRMLSMFMAVYACDESHVSSQTRIQKLTFRTSQVKFLLPGNMIGKIERDLALDKLRDGLPCNNTWCKSEAGTKMRNDVSHKDNSLLISLQGRSSSAF